MWLIKRLFDFYLNSSIHVAFAVCALCWITMIRFDVGFNINLLFFVFFASITGYNFVKYFGIAKFHYRSLISELKVIQLFSLFCFILLCYFALLLPVNTIVFLVILGGITFLYAIPFVPNKFYLDNQQNLRNVSGLKVYIVALVWTGVTLFLPLVNANFYCNTDVFITALQHFIFVIVLMLPFEIRDLKFDSLKLATIPQKIGVKRTKNVGVLLLLVFFFAEFFKDELSNFNLVKTFLITVITFLFLVFSTQKSNRYYSSFWVESIPIVWLLIVLI